MFVLTDFEGDAALAGIAAGLTALRAESRAEWSSQARSARVVELGRAVEALHAELVRAVAVWDGAGDHVTDGSLSSTAWLAHHMPMTRPAAQRLVATARMTRTSDPIAKALAAGEITVAHVEQIARAVHQREDIFATLGDSLINAALTVPPEAFRECATKWRANADDHVGKIDDPYDDSRDELTLSPTTGGLGIKGWFHSAAGVEILNLIDSYDHPDPVNGQTPPRSRAARRAAALYALLFDGRALAPKNIDLVIDEATLRREWTSDLTKIRCDVDGYGPVPCSLIRSWLTDATLRRVVMNGSEILDLGRATRLATPAQKRALRHRDRGCVVPGCARPPNWTDAHHLVAYLGGGHSDLDNYALVCRRHHHKLDRGWTLTRTTTGEWVFNPPRDPLESRGPP